MAPTPVQDPLMQRRHRRVALTVVGAVAGMLG
ncbi:MAG: hypothetical protein JWO64_1613, partial [Hyphomicrobiales bacterium]|nr:hypothetical protein [Hyphomicrobiales bacterium]